MMADSIGMVKRALRTEVIPVLERHEVQVLLEAGFSRRDVAARAGCSPKTVRPSAAERAVVQVADHAEAKTRGIGRPSLSAAVDQLAQAWLAKDPTTPTHQLLRRAAVAADASDAAGDVGAAVDANDAASSDADAMVDSSTDGAVSPTRLWRLTPPRSPTPA